MQLEIPTMKSLDADKKASKTSEAAPAEAEKTVEKIDFSKVKVEPLFEEMVDFDTFSKSDFRAVKVKACEAVKKSKKLLQFTLDDGTGTDRTILSGIHAYYEPEELVGKTLIAITNLPPRASSDFRKAKARGPAHTHRRALCIQQTPRKNPAAIKAPFPLRSPLLPLSYQICAAIARELSYSASQDVIFRWSGTHR